jgi:hypothetical protein
MENQMLVHKHLIVRAEAVNPPMEVQHLTDWLHNFIDSINMKVLMGLMLLIMMHLEIEELPVQLLLKRHIL